jgi:hypothetical protein
LLRDIRRGLRRLSTLLDSVIAHEYELEPGVVYHGYDPVAVEHVRKELAGNGIASTTRESWIGGGEGVMVTICVFDVFVPSESERQAHSVVVRLNSKRPSVSTS